MLRPQRSSSLFRQRWATEAGGESPLYTFVSITPNDGTELGGDVVTIVISGFDANDTNEIRFGCDAAGDGGDIASYTVTNSTTISVTTPLSSSGPGTVNVVVEQSISIRAIGLNVFQFLVDTP
jgi:hypothetical protein